MFTGGSLLFGSTGRPDLLGPDSTDAWPTPSGTRPGGWPPSCPTQTAVYPTHGFGSFCSATPVRRHRQHHRPGEAGQPGADDRRGPLRRGAAGRAGRLPGVLRPHGRRELRRRRARPDLSLPSEADPAELRRRIEAGEWVVDLRNRTAFAAGHVGGTLNFGLDGQFVTYLGWLIPWGTPVTLLGETAEDVAEAQRELVRIGIDRPAAMATGTPEELGRRRAAAQLPARRPSPTWPSELGRRPARPPSSTCAATQERAEGFIDGSVHIPIHEVLAVSTRSRPATVWVHCAGGYRAGVVAALLDAHGVDVVAIDDSFDNAGPAGLPLTTDLRRSPHDQHHRRPRPRRAPRRAADAAPDPDRRPDAGRVRDRPHPRRGQRPPRRAEQLRSTSSARCCTTTRTSSWSAAPASAPGRPRRRCSRPASATPSVLSGGIARLGEDRRPGQPRPADLGARAAGPARRRVPRGRRHPRPAPSPRRPSGSRAPSAAA